MATGRDQQTKKWGLQKMALKKEGEKSVMVLENITIHLVPPFD